MNELEQIHGKTLKIADELVNALREYAPAGCWVCGEWGCRTRIDVRADKPVQEREIDDPLYLTHYGCACPCHDQRLMLRAADRIQILTEIIRTHGPQWVSSADFDPTRAS